MTSGDISEGGGKMTTGSTEAADLITDDDVRIRIRRTRVLVLVLAHPPGEEIVSIGPDDRDQPRPMNEEGDDQKGIEAMTIDEGEETLPRRTPDHRPGHDVESRPIDESHILRGGMMGTAEITAQTGVETMADSITDVMAMIKGMNDGPKKDIGLGTSLRKRMKLSVSAS